ncbi:MAG TPA: TonB-dependent receptor [Longimicrobiales bacterium]|nr:TonB-dependent receptor [Longimicrobiales bacterium]
MMRLILLLLVLSSSAAAQTTGSIVGRVVDATSGAALAGADVRIDRLPHRTTTGPDGRFVIGGVPAGERDLRIEHIGYKSIVITRVQVRPGRAADVKNLTLETSPIEVAGIEVRADRQRLVEPEVSTTHEAVVGRELRELPVDRIEDVLELTTGVSGGHFRGGRIGQEVYVVDGVELKNQLEASRQGFGLELAPSSLEEVDVITGGFGAEYGSALSGVVSYTTRRGSPDRWESRVAFTTDHWAPSSLFRGFNGLNLSIGGPLKFLGKGATLYADLLGQGMLDADNRARGLTCLRPDEVASDLSTAIQNLQNTSGQGALYCPYSTGIIPHQRGDKLIAFGRFDKPLGSKWNLNMSVLRNRTQRELYTSEFKYNPTYQLGQRFTGSLGNINAEWMDQKPTGSTTFQIRSAVMRLDRYLGVIDPATFDGSDLGGFRASGFKFLGEDYARQDILQQLAAGSAIPGYIVPGGLSSPYGVAGSGIFFTTGTPGVASWSRSDLFSQDLTAARYTAGGSSYRAGVSGKLYKVETYERANAFNAGSIPNFARFFPATYSTFGEADIQTSDGMHFQFGVRLEAFRSGIDFQQDRVDFLSPVISTKWKLNLMPRFGVAFPIPGSEGRSGIRLNYGRVAQPPDFRYFLDSTIGDSLRTDIRRQGNPNLAFEKGTSYEAGLSHLFGENVALAITGFRKSLDNLVSGNLQLGGLGASGQFSTGDFGSVKGVETTLRARWSGLVVRLGWAVQKATGLTSGNENDSTAAVANPAHTEYPLAFDRRHSGDLAIFLGRAAGLQKPWSASITANAQSGYPLLRPGISDGSSTREATQYLPWTSSIDLRATWDFGHAPKCARCGMRVVFDGRNIMNSKNILAFRTNTGTIGPSLTEVQSLANSLTLPSASIPRESPAYVSIIDANNDGIITQDEARSARFAAALDRYDPTLFFGEGRQIRIGVELTF